MHGRKMTAADLNRVKAMFAAKGADFQFPNFGNNIMAKRVVESGSLIVAGAAARVTTEIYLFTDPSWESPRWRLEAIKFLQREMCAELKEKGITEGVAWIPPAMERAFGKRLVDDLGWDRCRGTDFVIHT
jgi:hypothetical protein